MVKYIEGSDEIKVNKCFQEVQAILDRYGCVLVPHVQIIANRIVSGIKLLPKGKEESRIARP